MQGDLSCVIELRIETRNEAYSSSTVLIVLGNFGDALSICGLLPAFLFVAASMYVPTLSSGYCKQKGTGEGRAS